MTQITTSLPAASVPRPALVTVLGTGWILMGFFAVVRALIVVAGLSHGIQVGSYDPNARMAVESPELVDPAYYEAQAQREDLDSLERRLGWFLLPLGGLAMMGGSRLLGHRSRARSLLLGCAVGSFVLTSAHVVLSARISLSPGEGLPVPEDFTTAFWAVAGVNILLQSLPVIVGASLLRHPSVARHARLGVE